MLVSRLVAMAWVNGYKKDFEERKAFVHELNHSQSVYHRNYEDKHRERGKKRFLGNEFRGER